MSKFSATEYTATYPDGILDHYWNKARVRILLRELRRLPNKGELLDIGCGRGNEVFYFQQHGLEAKGVDLGCPVPCSSAVEKYLWLGQDSIELNPSWKDRVKILSFLDVLEHVEHPDIFVKEHLDAYPNVEWILATVPARNELFSNYDEKYGHYLRYNLSELSNVISHSEIITLRYIFHGLYIPASLLRIFHVPRCVKIYAPKGCLRRSLHNLFSWYFVLERKFVPAWFWGTSVLGLFKV